MVTAILQQIRLSVRRSPSIHAALDSLGVLASGKRVYEQLLLRKSYIDTVLMGQSLRIAISSKREIARIDGFNEQEFVQQILDSLRPGDVIWDVGANIGLISLILARRAAELGATIDAFEPEQRNFDELGRNIELNDFCHVITPHRLALSDIHGEATLFVGGEAGEGSHSIVRSQEESRAGVTVPSETGSSFTARVSRTPNLVKIDVEGAEIRVVRGMRAILSVGAVRDVFIEVHPTRLQDEGASDRDLQSLLGALSYQVAKSIARDNQLQLHYQRSRAN